MKNTLSYNTLLFIMYAVFLVLWYAYWWRVDTALHINDDVLYYIMGKIRMDAGVNPSVDFSSAMGLFVYKVYNFWYDINPASALILSRIPLVIIFYLLMFNIRHTYPIWFLAVIVFLFSYSTLYSHLMFYEGISTNFYNDFLFALWFIGVALCLQPTRTIYHYILMTICAWFFLFFKIKCMSIRSFYTLNVLTGSFYLIFFGSGYLWWYIRYLIFPQVLFLVGIYITIVSIKYTDSAVKFRKFGKKLLLFTPYVIIAGAIFYQTLLFFSQPNNSVVPQYPHIITEYKTRFQHAHNILSHIRTMGYTGKIVYLAHKNYADLWVNKVPSTYPALLSPNEISPDFAPTFDSVFGDSQYIVNNKSPRAMDIWNIYKHQITQKYTPVYETDSFILWQKNTE